MGLPTPDQPCSYELHLDAPWLGATCLNPQTQEPLGSPSAKPFSQCHYFYSKHLSSQKSEPHFLNASNAQSHEVLMKFCWKFSNSITPASKNGGGQTGASWDEGILLPVRLREDGE